MPKTFLLACRYPRCIVSSFRRICSTWTKKIIPAESITIFETGVRYQFYHTFALLAIGILMERFPSQAMVWSGYCFILGIVLFSGSLYLLALVKSSGTVGISKIGIITPIGGLFFIAGWILLFVGLLKRNG